MKISVNTKTMEELFPHEDLLKNWAEHYRNSEMDILEFLALDKITPEDKIWVALKLMPKELVAAFALECSSRASAYAAKSSNYDTDADSALAASYAAKAASLASYVQDASYAASYAAHAAHAAYDASYAQGASDTLTAAAADTASAEERELQLKSIAQLIEESK